MDLPEGCVVTKKKIVERGAVGGRREEGRYSRVLNGLARLVNITFMNATANAISPVGL